MSEKCFCHIVVNGEKVAVKDAQAREDLRGLDARLVEVESKNNTQDTEDNDLRTRIGNAETDIDSINATLEEMEQTDSNLSVQISNLGDEFNNLSEELDTKFSEIESQFAAIDSTLGGLDAPTYSWQTSCSDLSKVRAISWTANAITLTATDSTTISFTIPMNESSSTGTKHRMRVESAIGVNHTIANTTGVLFINRINNIVPNTRIVSFAGVYLDITNNTLKEVITSNISIDFFYMEG